MIITILVTARSPQSHLIFVPFKIYFLNVIKNFALLNEDFLLLLLLFEKNLSKKM